MSTMSSAARSGLRRLIAARVGDATWTTGANGALVMGGPATTGGFGGFGGSHSTFFVGAPWTTPAVLTAGSGYAAATAALSGGVRSSRAMTTAAMTARAGTSVSTVPSCRRRTSTNNSCAAMAMAAPSPSPSPSPQQLSFRRGYAKQEQVTVTKGVTPPAFASQGRGQSIRAFMLSPGIIVDPWRGKRPWPKLSSLLGLAGWKALGRIIMRPLTDLYTLGQCQKIPGFTREKFKEEARDLYREINRLIAVKHMNEMNEPRVVRTVPTGNHHTALRSVCSEKAFSDIKREVRVRKEGGWATIDWTLKGFEAGTPDTLQGRVVQASPNDSSVGFAQITVRFKSKQTYAVYDKRGRLIVGDPDEVLDVEDIWVFEHGMKLPNSRWRLAARMSLPAPGELISQDGLHGYDALDSNETIAVDATAISEAARADAAVGLMRGGKKSKKRQR